MADRPFSTHKSFAQLLLNVRIIRTLHSNLISTKKKVTMTEFSDEKVSKFHFTRLTYECIYVNMQST